MYAYPAQIDGKNGLDIIAGGKHKNAQKGWFEAPKNARCLNQWKWHSISSVSWLMSIMMSDMDNDGDLDILISDRKGVLKGVRWLENPGTLKKQKEEWKNHNISSQGLEVMFLDLKDLDGDGLEDVIVTEATTRKIWFLKRLNKSGLSWESYPIDIPKYTSKSKSVVVGAVNEDGKLDLVHSFEKAEGNLEGVYWLSYKNLPTEAKWQWHKISGPKGIKYDRLELIDLDGDGDLDVLTCEENYGADSKGLGVIWYENQIKK
jgi:hypothetical protein